MKTFQEFILNGSIVKLDSEASKKIKGGANGNGNGGGGNGNGGNGGGCPPPFPS